MLAFSTLTAPARRPTSRRSRASISAGPVPGSRMSSRPQSTLTATRLPSLTTATTGTEDPAAPSSRHSPRAEARSVRASTMATSAAPASNSEDTSLGTGRTVWASSDRDGSTPSGFGSAVNSNRSNEPSNTRVLRSPGVP
ncbi:Uncharacterised protein [Mycobacteroides abscessus subsp. abscessus]|nr:Uncharacterised protein [Mycobacteroides abscessus subsp. abscessus]